MEPENELIRLISAQAKITEADVRKQIEEKEIEFSGMVSREGALFLVARELGIDLLEPEDKKLKIKNIIANMNGVNFAAKVIGAGPVREFKNEKGAGKVATIFLGDETGTIRLSLWNEKTEALSKIAKGDFLEVTGAYTKQDNRGLAEARIGKGGNLRKMTKEEAKIPEFSSAPKESVNFEKAAEGKSVSTKAYVVHIYDRPILYYLCPQCRKKLQNEECKEHGKVAPTKFIVLSCILDDGTGTINAAIFNKGAEMLFGKSTDEIEKTIKERGVFELIKSANLLGREIRIQGNVKKNNFTGNLELSVNAVKEIDTVNEINRILSSASAETGAEVF